MPAAGLEAFGRFPTMEREAGLRLMVENSLGERGVRERPELVEEIYALPARARADARGRGRRRRTAGATFDAYDRVGADRRRRRSSLHGGADNVVDPRNAELLGELIPNARLEIVPGSRPPARLGGGGALAPTRDRVPAVVTSQHTIGRWIRDRARTTPDRVAIDYDGRLVTYGELDDGAGRVRGRVRGGRADARRPRRDADRQHARARRGALRLREGSA